MRLVGSGSCAKWWPRLQLKPGYTFMTTAYAVAARLQRTPEASGSMHTGSAGTAANHFLENIDTMRTSVTDARRSLSGLYADQETRWTGPIINGKHSPQQAVFVRELRVSKFYYRRLREFDRVLSPDVLIRYHGMCQ